MMTIPMDNSADNPTRQRVQRLFNQNAELENRRRKAVQARIPSDPNAWQQMRENFQAILLEDHAFSEQHEIEYALWQLHYRRIEELRATYSAAVASAASNSSQNGKGPVRGGTDRVTKIRSQFKTFLTEATGFYHDLMLKIRANYGLPLDYFSGDSEGQIPMLQDGNKSTELKKGLISCHRCFIYLGDLARYKGLYGDGDSKALDFATASSYYMQATSLWPSSGNPHHQLAILASYSGDELVAIYRYFRSLAAESPFVTARDNLIIAFEKNRQSYSQLLGGKKPASTKSGSTRTTGRGRGRGDTRLQTKDTRSEGSSAKDKSCNISEVLKSFNIRFVRLNGILFTRTSLETFGEVFSVVRSDFLELLSSGRDKEYNFGAEASDCRLAVVRLIATLIFSIHNVNRETENQSYAEILQRSVLLENAFSATFELVDLMIEHCSLLNDPSTSYLLPGIMVFIEWLACHQDVAVGSGVEKKQASARLLFWNHCINFLNNIMSRGYMSIDVDEDEDETFSGSMTRYEEGDTANRLALPEDFELRGFLPLLPAQVILDFSGKFSYGSDGNKERNARMKRILAAGKALANVVRLGDERFYFDSKSKKFTIGHEPHISDDNVHTALEAPKLGGAEEENPALGQLNVDALPPKPQLHVEAEEEDEVIVFKPFMAEKKDDSVISKQYSSEVLVDEVNEAKVNMGNIAASFSDGLEVFLGQNAFSTTSRPPLSVGNTNPEYLQLLQPTTSVWPEQQTVENGIAHLNYSESGPTLKPEPEVYAKVNMGNTAASFSDGLEVFLGQNAFSTSSRPPLSFGNTNPEYLQLLQPTTSVWPEQQAVENGIAHVNFSESGPTLKPESEIYAGTLQPPAFSVHCQLPANNGGNYSVPMPQNLVPSKFDSIMSLGAENLLMKPSSVTASGLKKNPVSRPVRHMGPPPGFGSVPSKTVDESLHALSLKAENTGISQMDDYRWLDGYNLHTVSRNVGFNNSVSTAGHAYNRGPSSIDTMSFPFPGKQVMTFQPTMENLNGWPENHLSEQLKVYQEQQQQLYKGNQQPAVQKHQYQGQSLWEGFL